jgi:hypothetical protein
MQRNSQHEREGEGQNDPVKEREMRSINVGFFRLAVLTWRLESECRSSTSDAPLFIASQGTQVATPI